MWLRRLRVRVGRLLLARRLRRALPPAVGALAQQLQASGYEALLVGGCVRDLLLGRRPRDWDLVTSATARDLLRLFPEGKLLGAGRAGPGGGPERLTVLIARHGVAYELTPFRAEGLAADLAHRDFTVNALAADLSGRLHDPMGGLRDLASGRLRACGAPEDRLGEDPLRLLRAIRLAAQFDLTLERALHDALGALAPKLASVAPERIGIEFGRLLTTDRPAWALERLRELGMLAAFAPELLEMVGVVQNRFHAYPVWEHAMLATAAAPPLLHLRLAALLHDVAKPRCLSVDADGQRHFYGHEAVGADMAAALLERLRFDQETRRRVVHLVRFHMDLHMDGAATDAAIRRMVRRIGPEYLPDLIELRRADRIAAGTRAGEWSPDTVDLVRRVRQVMTADAALQVTDLAVSGDDVVAAFGQPPGPYVGRVLAQLLDEVLEEPERNTRPALLARLAELSRM